MPDTADKKYYGDIDKSPDPAFSASSERKIDIIPEPDRKRDVPPTPEFFNR